MKRLDLNSPWTRVFLAAVIEIAVVAAWYFLYYHPAQARINFLRSQRQLLNGKVQVAALSAMKIHRLQAEVDSLQNVLQTTRDKLFTLDRLDDVVAKLALRGRACGLVFDSVQPDYQTLVESKSEGPTVRLPIQIEATGRYFALGHFLDGLSELDFYFEPTGLSVQYDPAIYPKLKVHLNGLLYVRGADFPAVATGADTVKSGAL